MQGAKHFNPKIEILTEYAGSFGDAALGGKIAEKQIAAGADFIYPAAGFTGFGALKKAEEKGVLAGGVDSDQYFVAEKAVATSMVKNIDIAVFDLAKELTENGKIEASSYEWGLAENGVGLSEIRVISLTEEQKAALKKATEDIIDGKITVKAE